MTDNKPWIPAHELQPPEGMYVEAKWTRPAPGDNDAERVKVARRSSEMMGGWWYEKCGVELVPPQYWRHLLEPSITDRLQSLYENADCEEDMSVIKDAIAEITKLRKPPEWLDLEVDGPPPDLELVLVNHYGTGIEMAAIQPDGQWVICWTGFKHSGVAYTHWMPLPPKPEGYE